jgi:outer membrane protein OmpA-like peptidoglycan-associated protein
LEARTIEANKAKADAAVAQQQKAQAEDKARDLEAQLRELSAKQTERGILITLNDVLFAVNQADLTSAGMIEVQKLGYILQQNPLRTVVIEGYTDSTGTASYNLDLSQRRADAVLIALLHMGVGPERVVTRGYGREFPVASNGSAMGRQLNRRVEIILSGENVRVLPRG